MLREYFIGVISVATVITLALGIAHPKLKSATVFGSGALMICSILLPLVDIIRDFDIEKSIDGIFDGVDYDATDSAIELAFEEGVAEYISTEYGVSVSNVEVHADGFDIAILKAARIYVTLSGDAIVLDYKRIEEEVKAQFTLGGECEVSLSLG